MHQVSVTRIVIRWITIHNFTLYLDTTTSIANLADSEFESATQMANLSRSAKSGSDWTDNDLSAYNITIVSQDAATFFGQPALPQPALNPELLTTLNAEEIQDDECYKLVRYMDLAMNPIPGEESAVDDFTMRLLRAIGYETRNRDLRSRKSIPLFICGMWMYAKTDVCVMDSNQIMLLVQEDKQHLELRDATPQLIAEAIAAFQSNNARRHQVLNLPPLASKVMAGITMTGTSPTFFKIPVTAELNDAIRFGHYPAAPTVVAMHIPDLPRPARRLSEGMRPLDNRRNILACFEAFKQFVNWSVLC